MSTTQIFLEDDAAEEMQLPFVFPFFGLNYTRVFVLDNGALSFSDDPPCDKTFIGHYFDKTIIAPLWVDLRPDMPGTNISSTISTDHFRVQWRAPQAVMAYICGSHTPQEGARGAGSSAGTTWMTE
eukprot:SAG31_NODE_21039_length_559_cov_1.013043_1_plen_125_part_10